MACSRRPQAIGIAITVVAMTGAVDVTQYHLCQHMVAAVSCWQEGQADRC